MSSGAGIILVQSSVDEDNMCIIILTALENFQLAFWIIYTSVYIPVTLLLSSVYIP